MSRCCGATWPRRDIVEAVPQLLLSLMVQKYIVRGLTMGAVK